METLKRYLPDAMSANLKPYMDRRILSVFLLGIAQGLPWTIIGSMLTLWLKESGIGRADIGYAALIFSVYAINFLWSPVIDFWSPPYLRKIGRRKSWVVLCQILIAGVCLVISTQDPTSDAKHVVLLCLVIAIFSATQDIAIDAYRVDSFSSEEGAKISAASGAITAGWWTGYAGIGALPLALSDHGWSWPQLYFLLGAITLVLAIITCLLPKAAYANAHPNKALLPEYLPVISSKSQTQKYALCLLVLSAFAVAATTLLGYAPLANGLGAGLTIVCILLSSIMITRLAKAQSATSTSDPNFVDIGLAWLLGAVIAPLKDFFTRNGFKVAILLLLFITSFKLGEAFLGRMSIVFYKEIGFSNTQIATYSKLLTWWLTVVFALIGGIVNSKFGLFKGLIVSGIAMAGTNLIFSLIAITGPIETLYAIAIIADGFAAAWSTVAFVTFISILCNHAFSATQYALLASLSNLGKTTISSTSGQLVDYLDGNWALFFTLTAFMVIPSLAILWRLRLYLSCLSHSQRRSE